MSTEVNLNWWQRRSTPQKVALALLTVGTIIVGVKLAFPKKEDPKLPEGNATSSTTPPATPHSSETPNNTTQVEAAPATQQPGALPAGKTCGPLHDDFDENFNYCKCADGWYTISKERPKDAQYANKYPNWVDIKTHATNPDLAIQRLDARYAN